jgi:alpha-mannosidase
MPNETLELHVISNTHWDREWLYDFQETRMLLVEFMDKLLALLDSEPRYRSYLLDSQTVPLEDYLEVRPDERGRIERLVRDGRLHIGPWYTCPEEFNVNGESLVRNLLMGHIVAESFGGVMKVGYSPFSYGQASQMAQIYSGFGIDTILFYHGITPDESRSEFILEGPDGSRLFGSRMGSFARYNFFYQVFRPAVYGKQIHERRYLWDEGGLPFHLCGPGRWRSHHFLVDPRKGLDRDKLIEGLNRLRQVEREHAATRYIACMMGMDSTEPDPREVEIVEQAKKIAAPDTVIHSSLGQWLAKVKQAAKNLAVLRGERRTPRELGTRVHLFGDVTSSRVRVKRANGLAEHALQRQAEPFAAMAWLLGEEYPKSLLDIAWRYLLRCHAHDSIAGSGVDQIERDMHHRLDQVRNISAGLMRRAFQAVARRVDDSDLPPQSILVSAFNPSPRERSEVVTAYVDLPAELGINQFDIIEAQSGRRVEMQEVSREDRMAVVRHLGDATMEMPATTVQVHFHAERLPALGYRTYIVRARPDADRLPGSLVSDERTMENEHLRLRVNGDGTLDVADKATGRTFAGLHYFEDGGEAGHAWRHLPPALDRIISTRGASAVVALEQAGPLAATYRVDYTLELPERLVEGHGSDVRRLDGDGDCASRSESTLPLRITSHIALRKGARCVEIITRCDNRCRDHRLRVMFPTHLNAATSDAESAFDVVERAIARGPDSPWRATWNPTHPQQRFVDVSDGSAGLAIINDGLREYEVTDTPDRTIAVTLLRAYEVALTTVSWRWERHPEMMLSQSPGEHEFRYWIYPHAGRWWHSDAFVEAERLNVPVEVAQSGPHAGELPKEMSFLNLEPEAVVLSAVKRAERSDALIVRAFNPTDQALAARLTLFRPIRAARLTNLNEEPQDDLAPEAGASGGRAVTFEVGPKKVVTLVIEVK